jgi:hypothetical protein
MKTIQTIREAVFRVETAFEEICGIGAGSGFTLQPTATRANVVAMTQVHGIVHLREMADGLSQLAARDPGLFDAITATRNITELNCGAGLGGLLVALLATEAGPPPSLIFIDHAPAAVHFAVELAGKLGLKATGAVVEKEFAGVAPGEVPDHNGNLLSATLQPALPQLFGPSTVVAGHALSVNNFAPGNRKANLALQNRLALAQVDAALDPAESVVLLQLDIAHRMAATMPDFAGLICAKGNASTHRRTSAVFEASPANRTPGREGRRKYFATLRLAPLPSLENLVAWAVGDGELLLTEFEVEALIGVRARPSRYEGLRELIAQGVK